MKPEECEEEEDALYNDSGNQHRVLHYYIHRLTQARQFSQVHFELLVCFDNFGMSLSREDCGHQSPSLLHVARRL